MLDISASALAAQLFTGLVLGGIFVLLAIGLSLIFGLMTVVNFAHGSLYMLGAYFGFFLLGASRSFWVSFLVAPLIALAVRSLAPGDPPYRPRYDGDLRARDAAYHQGTVWAWLIGPFVDAWLRVHPEDRAGARRFLEGFAPHLGQACIGSISGSRGLSGA